MLFNKLGKGKKQNLVRKKNLTIISCAVLTKYNGQSGAWDIRPDTQVQRLSIQLCHYRETSKYQRPF